MLFRLSFFLLFTFSSCALFKPAAPLTDSGVDALLNAVRMTGEGRGRLSLEKGQNVFSYEAALNDDGDWLLAVAVPLHGEEVMVLNQIREARSQDEGTDDFEARLGREIDSRIKGNGPGGEEYLRALRSLVRFVLAPTLSLKRECRREKEGPFECTLDEDKFQVEVREHKIFIRKDMKEEHFLELIAENLTESFFSRNSFHLHSKKALKKQGPIFTLELFWK